MANSPQPQSRQEAPKLDLSAYSFDALLGLKEEIGSEGESAKLKRLRCCARK